MKIEVFLRLYPLEAQVCCLECQFLHQPNPEEDYLICLKTLQRIVHEIDFEIECSGFHYISLYWVPVYDSAMGMYF